MDLDERIQKKIREKKIKNKSFFNDDYNLNMMMNF